MTQSFGADIADTIQFVGRALARVEKGDGAEDREVHNIRAYLVNTLELIERDPGIEAPQTTSMRPLPSL